MLPAPRNFPECNNPERNLPELGLAQYSQKRINPEIIPKGPFPLT